MPTSIEPAARARPTARSLEHVAVLALSLLGLVAVVVLGTLVTPDPRGYGTHERFGMPPCHMLEWTGIPCPGCGVTTSIALAAHGEVGAALHNQPFGLLLALLLPLAGLWALVQHVRGADLGRFLSKAALIGCGIGLGALALAAWAWKIGVVRGWIA